MKGILVKGLALVVILSGSVVAQEVLYFDTTYVRMYGASLLTEYPTARDFNGGGARARGMGNAFIGVSDDASAVSWNPAGLYRRENQYTQPVISLSYQSLSSDAGFTSQPYPLDYEPRQFDFNDAAKGVNFMSIVLPLRIKGHVFIGSLAYSRLGDEVYSSGMGFDVMMPFDPQDDVEGIDRPYHYQINSNYRSGVNAMNIGFGTRIYNDWSFGLAVNAYGGRAAQVRRETVTWEDLIIPGLPGNQRGTGMIVNDRYDTTSFSGTYFTLGLRYASERMSAGLTIKAPHTLKGSIDSLAISQGYANGSEVQGATSKEYYDDNIIELDQPMVLGGGLGLMATEKLLLAFDVEYRPYAGGMVNRRDSLELVPGGTDIEYFTEFDPYWNSTWAIRVGGEYVWETGGRIFPTIPIRIGMGYVQLPQPSVDGYVDENGVEILSLRGYSGVAIPVTSVASVTKWSLGTGVRWAQIDLDFAYEKSSGGYANSFFVQDWSIDNGAFCFTFTGYF